MEIPNELKTAIALKTSEIGQTELSEIVKTLSARYKLKTKGNERIVTKEVEAAAYSAVRMPATYCAVLAALGYTGEYFDLSCISSVLDAGAGTGASAWAASLSLDSLERIVCIEREQSMLSLGKEFAAYGTDTLRQAEWIKSDISSVNISEKFDMVIASYMLNEIDVSLRAGILNKLWESTDKILLIVEPGTPLGYSNIHKVREYFLKNGAYIISPCPHMDVCPISEGNWCHFTCRVARTKLHKQLKGGDVPYEDEKFSYIALSKKPSNRCTARILRHPQNAPGHISLELCTSEGLKSSTITKKDKELYKIARKASCGDSF